MDNAVIALSCIGQALAHTVRSVGAHVMAQIAAAVPDGPFGVRVKEQKPHAHHSADGDAVFCQLLFYIEIAERLHQRVEITHHADAERMVWFVGLDPRRGFPAVRAGSLHLP